MAQVELLDRDGKVLKSYQTKGNPPKSARRQSSDYVTETITGAGTFFSKKFIEDTINNIQKNPITGAFTPKGDPRKLSIPIALAGILFVRSKTPEKKKNRVTLFGLAGILAHEILKSFNDNVGAASSDGNGKGGEELITKIFGEDPNEIVIFLKDNKIFTVSGEIDVNKLKSIVREQKDAGKSIGLVFDEKVTNGFHQTIINIMRSEDIVFSQKIIKA